MPPQDSQASLAGPQQSPGSRYMQQQERAERATVRTAVKRARPDLHHFLWVLPAEAASGLPQLPPPPWGKTPVGLNPRL